MGRMEKELAAMAERSFQLHLLGPPIVTWQGDPFELPRRQARALLYRLAIDLLPVTRDELIFLFWPDIEETTARQNLSRMLSYMRNALPQGLILSSQAATIRLSPAIAWSDSRALLSLAKCDEDDALQEAAARYRGPFLSGVALAGSPEYEGWLRGQQRRFERHYLALLRRLLQIKRDAAEYEVAMRYAQQYLAIDELAEEVHRQLIFLYGLMGDRAAVLRQFEHCALVLRRELGVEPSPQTRALHEQLARGEMVEVIASPERPGGLP